jgi:hypothetical protein
MSSIPGHAPGAPFLGSTRLRGLRELTPHECDLVGYAGPLGLSRREYRFFVGPWRPSKYYVVTHRTLGDVMVCTRREIESLGVEID